jgi:hypothetical protein
MLSGSARFHAEQKCMSPGSALILLTHVLQAGEIPAARNNVYFTAAAFCFT